MTNQPTNNFSNKGYCVINIKNTLKDELNNISRSIYNETENNWNIIYKNTDEQRDIPVNHDKNEISTIYNKCLDDYNKGNFCFFFKRLLRNSTNLTKGSIAAQKTYDFCNSPIFRSIIEYNTGRNIGNIDIFYINKFSKGDFLTTHTDAGNNLGIVLNISENWNPNFGGLTHILDKDTHKIIDTLTPAFGELFIFDTSKKQVPHFVSMTTSDTASKRISIVARYGARM